MKIKSVVKKALQYLGLLGIFWKFIAVNNARKNKKLYKSLVSFYFNFKPREFNEAYEVLCDERQVNKSLNRYKKHAELFIISVLKPCLTKQDMENQEIGVVLKEFYGDELASDLSKAFNTLEVECPLKNACTRESSPLEQLISSLKKTMPQKEKRLTLVKILIQVLIDDGRVPKFYELDYIDNIEGMIKGLYPTNAGVMIKQSNNFLSALSSLSFSADYKPNLNWSEKLRNLGISGEEFKPHVSKSANSYVKEVMPDQYDSFGTLLSSSQEDNLIIFNKEYSKRQFLNQGKSDNRDVSLLRGYEQNHHILLRTIISLINEGKLHRDEKVLIIGPRHIDEIDFFRTVLGMKNAIGLDLFDVEGYIVSGDMHDMAFNSGTFKLIYSAGTIAYSYDVRKVFKEMTRVLQPHGYIMVTDAMDRKNGVDPLGRSDVVDCDVAIGMFHEYDFRVLAKDEGIPLNLNTHLSQPSFCIEISR